MARSFCNCCQTEVFGHVVKCAECTDFDLCLQCFSLGAEVGSHKKEHGYQITSAMTVGAFEIDEPWTLAEETMLLDAVEQYGFGNWEDVASHVESKSPEECETHYNSFYIWGNIGKAACPKEPFGKVTDHCCPEGGPLSPSITVPVNPLELTIQEQHELGYMPFRDDFEREHDNEAETLVSSLMVAYDDDDLDIEIKLTQIEKYRMRLKERDRRKQLARHYGLITAAAQSAAAAAIAASTPGPKPSKSPYSKKRGSKEDREFQDKLKPFAQCHSCSEHETFLENHQKERELKNRIKELLRYRKNGLTKLEATEKFEEERYKREKRKEYRLKKLLFTGKAKFNGLKKSRKRRKIRFTHRRKRTKR